MLAGEHSGDKIGAKLINQLKEYSNLEIVGVGGPAMEKAGLKSIIPVSYTHLTLPTIPGV